MSEAEAKTQGQKPKISKLAIASLLAPVMWLFVWHCFISLLGDQSYSIFERFLGFILYFAGWMLPVSFVMGIWELIKIIKSKGLLKGYILAVLGILMSIVACGSWLRGWIRIREEAPIAICQRNMMKIAKAIQIYSNNHDGRYPTASKWCDLLINETNISKDDFSRFSEDSKWGGPHYAMNPNAEPNSPPDLVLLFESKGGWNQFGGKELLTTENHKGYGCNILFNDGRVEFVEPKQLGELKWKVEEGNSVE